MRKLTAPSLLRAALVLLALAASAQAQGLVDARSALSTFPDAQAVFYINARRLVNEAAPRVIPKAEYDKLIAQSRQVGFDVRHLDSIAVGARFVQPAAPGGLPVEFVVVVRGSDTFNANTLVELARVGASTQGLKPTEENYLNKPIQVFDLSNLGRGGDPNKPPAVPFKEIAIAALDSHTLVAGIPSYVRAAVDAAGGQGRLKAATLDMAARDPQALWSLTAELPPDLAQHIQKLGVPPNEEVNRILGWLKQISLSNGMDALNFTMRAAVLTDSPEHASAITGLARMGLTAAESAAKQEIERKKAKPDEAREAQIALGALRTFTATTEGNTVLLGVSIPQSAVSEIVKREMLPKPKPKPKPTTRRRRPARRT